ncbi:MAG: COG3014 family protein [Pseudobdellovibrio sp.]
MFKLLSLLLIFIAFSSCATHRNEIAPIQKDIQMGRCTEALAALQKKADETSDDQLLYLMEYGSGLQICKQYALSNEALQKADKLSEDIDYVSITRAVGSTLLNEQVSRYKGDKFEKLFLNAMGSLNYLELGDLDNAMVEVRRINEKTQKFSTEESKTFELNSFASYLSGLVYELGKKYDDACISYKDSYNLDSSYRVVALDMLTACWRARRQQEFKELSQKIGATQSEIEYAKRSDKNSKEIFLIFEQGWGPQKATRRNDPVWPILVPVVSNTQRLIATSETEGNNTVKMSETVYSVEKAAIQTIEEDYKTLGARRLGARVAKEVVADQIRQKDRALGDLAWIVMVASERADLRNWSMLPQSIQIIRMDVDKINSLKLIGQGSNGQTTEDLGLIDLTQNPNKKVYLIKSLQ